MNTYLRNIALGIASLALLCGIAASQAHAQTAPSSTSVAVQVEALLRQIQDLRAQLADLEGTRGEVRQDLAETVKLARDLARGMSGEDVEELQKLLAEDSEVYPEGLVTGFFGPLTERALARWQQKFGFEGENGRMGPMTRLALNAFWRQGGWRRHVIDDATSTATTTPGMRGQKVRICHEDSQTLSIALPALRAHLGHGDSLGACAEDRKDRDDKDEDEDDDDEDEIEVRGTLDEGEEGDFRLGSTTHEVELLSITDEDDLDDDEEPTAEFSHDGEESGDLEEGDEYEFDGGLEIEVKSIDVDDDEGTVTFVLSIESEDDDDED